MFKNLLPKILKWNVGVTGTQTPISLNCCQLKIVNCKNFDAVLQLAGGTETV